jgi:two-component system LytT family sensor kinase
MVENAIKHGIEKRAQGGCIRIAAARDAGMLTLAIYNDGPALAEPLERVGIGIANARLRLQRLYGDRFALTLRNASSGVLASVSVPMGEDS